MPDVIILSGGMDSAVLLAHILTQTDDLRGLTFSYGAKHNERENDAARQICRYFDIPQTFMPLPFIGEFFSSALLKTGGEIPDGHYEDESMRQTVVPFRNGIMLAIAAGFAESIGATRVFYGAHAGDHAIYPDCRSIFVGAMREAVRLGTYKHIRLEAPFNGMTKREIGLLGRDLKVPFEMTYSCYKGGEKHCGRCGTCVERREALTGFDPTDYE